MVALGTKVGEMAFSSAPEQCLQAGRESRGKKGVLGHSPYPDCKKDPGDWTSRVFSPHLARGPRAGPGTLLSH